MEGRILALGGMLFAFVVSTGLAQQAPPKGVYSFGPDQTIADIGKMEWAPLKLEGLPPGIEIAALRGDLAKGGGEILLRTPPKYVVPTTAIPAMSCTSGSRGRSRTSQRMVRGKRWTPQPT
jgi:hypothetical protein